MIEFVAETGSTNADLLARLSDGDRVAEGRWLVARRQSAGRGRQGRTWFDGSGNFMGSTVVHVGESDPPAQSLALLAGLAVYEAVLPLCPDPHSLRLKWPNDLLLGDAKLCGILLEGQGKAVVIGIGVNLAVAPDVPDRKTIALADVTAAPGVDEFAGSLARCFDRELERWRTFGLEPLIRRWRAAGTREGTSLAVHEPDGAIASGTFAGLDDQGNLLLRLEDGRLRAIHAGDVTLA
ncbi:biotin--[acetyl-CoA-carboxylase] ligase [Altererythrobacter arenosus]|uniref:biotin--[biotin carboxyl-carrier protein] ligase n=1 Tax=Altererythrobacter arenosus TaxID=3032592 RepID=A0ABY8FQ53_9SPHN|nr:biotin--[acetyl-CoA-carboxylase] ligase [Altererythrobacter sp. CAU 1644]WFL77138.1 biotin--[acetyl-CoA-carboxylase] ligase [Altererythrobacter sp. CAU 1644]